MRSQLLVLCLPALLVACTPPQLDFFIGACSDTCGSYCSGDPCGDGALQPLLGEECDDGNEIAGDGCEADCTTTIAAGCGDGWRDKGEVCDDGNNLSGDGCRADCAGLERCGDGVLDPALGESCDDGNTEEGDGCPTSCALSCSRPGVEEDPRFQEIESGL